MTDQLAAWTVEPAGDWTADLARYGHQAAVMVDALSLGDVVILLSGRRWPTGGRMTEAEAIGLGRAVAAELHKRNGRSGPRCPSGSLLDVTVRGHHCNTPHEPDE